MQRKGFGSKRLISFACALALTVSFLGCTPKNTIVDGPSASAADGNESSLNEGYVLRGVPELFNIRWGADTVLLKSLYGDLSSLQGNENMLYPLTMDKYHNLPCLPLFTFDDTGLIDVKLAFSSEDVSLAQLIGIVQQAYQLGEPTYTKDADSYVCWEGSVTNLEAYESSDGARCYLQFSLSKRGSGSSYETNAWAATDPMDFVRSLGLSIDDFLEEYNFTDNPSYYRKEEGRTTLPGYGDTDVTIYSFFPTYIFMGAKRGGLTVSVYVPPSGNVEMIYYSCPLDRNDSTYLIEQIETQHEYLKYLLGDESSFVYYPPNTNGSVINEITSDEIFAYLHEMKMGSYSIEWTTDKLFVSLFFAMNESSDSALCGVMFSDYANVKTQVGDKSKT